MNTLVLLLIVFLACIYLGIVVSPIIWIIALLCVLYFGYDRYNHYGRRGGPRY